MSNSEHTASHDPADESVPGLPESSYDVLLFASLAEQIGRSSLSLSLPRDATAGDLIDSVRRLQPAFDSLLSHTRVAVDHRFREPHEAIFVDGTDAPEIALIPPVSGG